MKGVVKWGVCPGAGVLPRPAPCRHEPARGVRAGGQQPARQVRGPAQRQPTVRPIISYKILPTSAVRIYFFWCNEMFLA